MDRIIPKRRQGGRFPGKGERYNPQKARKRVERANEATKGGENFILKKELGRK